MKAKSKTKQSWPPILRRAYPSGQVGWMIAVMLDGKRIRETFKTEDAAESRAQEIRAAKAAEGKGAFAIPTALRIEAQNCADKLAGYGSTITAATDYYVKHVLAYRNKPSVAAVLAEMIETKRRNNRSEKTILNFRTRCERFALTYGNRELSTVTKAEIESWLANTEVHGRELNGINHINYLRAVGNLFTYGMRKGYCGENPVKSIDRPTVTHGEVEHLTVSQVAALLAAAADYDLVPYVAIGCFAGLRPERELGELDWSRINLAERSIVVTAATAKTKTSGRGRRVVEICDALAAILAPYAKPAGKIVDMDKQALRKNWEACRTAAKITYWPHDAMRHTFGTYHMAKHRNENKTAFEMGNSPAVVHDHYKALVTQTDAERFWNLRPDADADNKIVAMPKAVNA